MSQEVAEFLRYRIGVVGVMENYSTKIAGIVEESLESILEVCDKIKQPFLEAKIQDRRIIIETFGDIVDNLTEQAKNKVDNLATMFVSDMITSSENWVNELDVTPDEFSQALDVLEMDIEMAGYNAVDENIPYIKKQIVSGFANNIVDPNSASFLEDVFQELIAEGIIESGV